MTLKKKTKKNLSNLPNKIVISEGKLLLYIAININRHINTYPSDQLVQCP